MSTANIVLPKTVAAAIRTKVKDDSTIAALSPKEGKLFQDENYLIFDGASEAEVVAEGAAKGYYTQPIAHVVANRATIQTTTRVSKQLKWADEDDQLEIVRAIQDDQAQAMGRAIDYLTYHAINPKTGAVLDGYTALTAAEGVNDVYLGAALASATDKQLVASIDNMAEAVNDGYDINGFALAKPYANALRKIRVSNTMNRLYPEIPLNLKVGNIEGIPAACSGTVNGRLVATTTGEGQQAVTTYGTDVLGIMGNFALIRWGFVRDIMAEVIEFGDPDGQGDLKRYNQIAFRTEAVLAWAVLDPAAFAILHAGVEG
jgi:hypothetical protein